MARIAGVDLPPKKRVEVGLTYIYGIGRTRSKSLLHRAGIDFDKKVGDRSEEEVNHIRHILEDEATAKRPKRKGSPPGDLQQHDRPDSRSRRSCELLVERGFAGAPRSGQGHTVRGAAGVDDGGVQGEGSRAARGGRAGQWSGV